VTQALRLLWAKVRRMAAQADTEGPESFSCTRSEQKQGRRAPLSRREAQLLAGRLPVPKCPSSEPCG